MMFLQFRRTPKRLLEALFGLVLATSLPLLAGDWEHYGGDLGGSKFSDLQQITPANVGKLQQEIKCRISNSISSSCNGLYLSISIICS